MRVVKKNTKKTRAWPQAHTRVNGLSHQIPCTGLVHKSSYGEYKLTISEYVQRASLGPHPPLGVIMPVSLPAQESHAAVGMVIEASTRPSCAYCFITHINRISPSYACQNYFLCTEDASTYCHITQYKLTDVHAYSII